MTREELFEKLNITEDDFKPNTEKQTDADRIAVLEDAFSELCEEVLA